MLAWGKIVAYLHGGFNGAGQGRHEDTISGEESNVHADKDGGGLPGENAKAGGRGRVKKGTDGAKGVFSGSEGSESQNNEDQFQREGNQGSGNQVIRGLNRVKYSCQL
jgi:hypothetical protein